MSSKVRAIIPTGFGINCEAETARALELAGADPLQIHLNDLIARPEMLSGAGILVLAGGFSFGDHLGAGKVFANRLRRRLGESVSRFVERGGLVLGICNGFQTLARLGLVPDGNIGAQVAALGPNSHGCFYDGWITLAVDPSSPCLFTKGLDRLEVPVRHGEGRLLTSPETLGVIREHHLAPVRYANPDTGQPSEEFPENPNGSLDSIAGLCDRSGRIFGLMPHPEAFLFPENHPQWRGRAKQQGEGLVMFRNAVREATGCK
jgi:phosphoribosylformylglycinamidine synthase